MAGSGSLQPLANKSDFGVQLHAAFAGLHSREVQKELFTLCTGADEAAVLWKRVESAGVSGDGFS